MLPRQPTAKLVDINSTLMSVIINFAVGPKFLMALHSVRSPQRTGNTQCSPRLQYPLTVLSSGIGKPVVVLGASGAAHCRGPRGSHTVTLVLSHPPA